MGETLEDGVDLGQVTGTLQKVGVQVLDSEDKMRNVGDIMEDLMEVWAELDSTQKNAIATTLAGKYQLTRFEALMNRSDLYEDYKAASEGAEGTMDEMQSEYQNSLVGKLNTLQASFEGLLSSVFETSDFYGMIDAVSTLLDKFNELIDAIGGSGAALTALGAIGTKVFNAQLSRGIEGLYNRVQNKRNSEDMGVQQLLAEGLKTPQGERNKDLLAFASSTQANKGLLTEEELRYRNEQLSVAVKLRNEAIAAEEQLEQKVNETNRAYALTGKSTNDVYRMQEVGGKATGEVELQSDQKVSAISRSELIGSEKFQSLKANSGAAVGQLERLKAELDRVEVKEGKVNAATARMYRQFVRKEVVGNIREVMTALGRTGAEVEQIDSLLANLTPKTLKDTKSIETAINSLIEKMRELNGWTQRAENSNITTISQNFENETGKFQITQQQDEASVAQRGELDESLSSRDRISSIVNVAQAVSSLAFTWQSFQSLGSIWENADLTTGQKLEQTVLNLAMTMPMLIMGVTDLIGSGKVIKDTVNAVTTSLIAQKFALMGGRTAAAAYVAELTLTQKAGVILSAGMTRLGTAIKGVAAAVAGFARAHPAILLLSVAAGAAATAIGGLRAAEEERIQKIEESAQKAKETSSSIAETQKSFKELYASYRQGNASLDSLKESANSVNDVLGDQKLKALEAAGAWEAYSDELDRASKKKLEENYNVLEEESKTKAANIEGNRSVWTNYVGLDSFRMYKKDRVPDWYTDEFRQATSDQNFSALQFSEAGEVTKSANSSISDYISQLQKLQEIIDNLNFSNLTEQQQRAVDAFKESIGNTLSGEDAKTWLENEAIQGEIDTSLYGDDVSFAYAEGISIDDYKNQLRDELAELGKEASEAELEAFVTGMMEADTESAKALAKQYAKEFAENADTGIETEPDLTNIMNEEERSAKLEELDIQASDFENYKNALLGTNKTLSDFNKENKRTSSGLKQTTKQIQDQINEYESLDELTEEQQEELEDLRKEQKRVTSAIEDSENATDSLAVKLVETAQGAQELGASFEESSKKLKASERGTREWVDATQEIGKGLGHLLNIDMSSLGDSLAQGDFITKHFNDIKLAIDGDVEALQRLRSAAAQQILINAGLNPEADAEIFSQMNWIIDWANQNLPSIEAGATIDDSAFTSTLYNMIQNALAAGASIDSILAYLDGLGLQADIKTKTVDVYMTADETAVPGVKSGKTITQLAVPEADWKVTRSSARNYGGSPNLSSGGKSGGGSGGGKKGGGGGSGSKYEPKEMDKVDEEVDRYEKVNTKLAAIGNDYERIADEQDRLTGHELTDNMNKQIDLLEEQIKLQEKKQKIQRQERAELEKDLSKKYGIDFEEDSEGNRYISNYASVQKRLENNVNKLVKQYNNTKTEKGQSALEEKINKAKKKLEDFNETYQRYDELVSEDMKESQKAIEDYKDSIEDLRIEAFKASVEAVDNIKDVQEKLSEFNAVFSGRESDDPFREMTVSADKLGKYIELDTDKLNQYYDTIIKNSNATLNDPKASQAEKNWAQKQISQAERMKGQIIPGGTGYIDLEVANLRNILDEVAQFELTGRSDIFGENSAELYETLKSVYDSAAQMLMDFEGQIEELEDNILSAIDDIDERMQDRLDQYEDITDELEHQAKLIEMVQGDRSYDQINMALTAQNKNYQQQIVEIQSNIASWEELKKSMIEGSEEWKSVQEKITEGQKQINSLIESNLENLRKVYENNVNKLLDNWTVNTPLGSDLEWMEDQWELINRNADYYLDDVNAAYNIQKLQGKYLELLDGTNDLHIQQQITDQMGAQLGYLREKEKISEYDVAYAEAQLQILQKRIALEEAQRNKSQMKLKRDSQGNYSYVYTANQEDVAGAEGDLLDAQNNAYNLSKNQMKETQQDSLSALVDAKNALNQIWNDANLSLAEKTERSKTILDSLKEYLAGTQEQLSESEKNIIEDFMGMVDLMSEENAERLGDTYDELVQKNYEAFDQVDTRFSTSITDWLANLDSFRDESDSLHDNLIANANDWQQEVDITAQLVEQNFNNMKNSIKDTADMTDILTQSQRNFSQAVKDDIGTVSAYEEQLKNYRNEAARLTEELNYKSQVEQAANKLTATELEKNANTVTGNDGKGGKNGNDKGNGKGGKDGNGKGSGSNGNKYAGTSYSQGQLIEGIAGNIWTYGTWGNGQDRKDRLIEKFGSKGNTIYEGVQTLFNGNPAYGYNYNPKKWSTDGYGYYKKFAYSSFDTGGYTGAWGNDNGKFALLHQKELVLNASDTKNMLAMIDAVRQTVNTLKSDSLSSVFSKIGSGFIGGESQKLEQQVNIDATFPNVQDSNEIQDALLTLIDQAPQYIYKTR